MIIQENDGDIRAICCLVGELIAGCTGAQVSELNVYQEGIVSILPYIDTIIRDYLDDCSQ